MQPLDISQQILDAVPGMFFYKDHDFKYLRCNKTNAKMAGGNEVDYLIGKTDEDCPWASFAEDYRVADEQVIKGETITVLEPFINKHGKYSLLHTQKSPLFHQNNVIGIIGHCQFIGAHKDIIQPIHKLLQDNLLPIKKLELKKNFNGLTKRESEVLFFVVRCLSMKEIASRMEISKRTVEYYSENIKSKFGCKTLSELIAKAIYMGYHYLLPESLLDKL